MTGSRPKTGIAGGFSLPFKPKVDDDLNFVAVLRKKVPTIESRQEIGKSVFS